MKTSWKELFAFTTNVSLLIDHNLEEHNIRKLTPQRNNLVHFSSDEEMETVVFHSVISTLKFMDKSAWNFISEYFNNIVNGSDNFVGSTLPVVTLAVPIVK